MTVFRLDHRLVFPPVHLAEPSGLLAVGGDLSPERLLLAYREGIFPWYGEGLPILWHSPDPRMVITADALIVQRSLRKAIRKRPYELRLDTAFADVIRSCGATPRPDQDGTWITSELAAAYIRLFELGHAHSAEAWLDGELVGGLYGVSLGGAFLGESMFTTAPDASKIAFVALVRQLAAWGIGLIDAQVHTEHLERFGASLVPRTAYLRALGRALVQPTRPGPWRWQIDPTDVALLIGAEPSP